MNYLLLLSSNTVVIDDMRCKPPNLWLASLKALIVLIFYNHAKKKKKMLKRLLSMAGLFHKSCVSKWQFIKQPGPCCSRGG